MRRTVLQLIAYSVLKNEVNYVLSEYGRICRLLVEIDDGKTYIFFLKICSLETEKS